MTTQLLAMSKKDIDRHEILTRLIRKEIKRSYAAKLLKLTVRQVTRLKTAVVVFGASARSLHKQRGKFSHNRISEKERTKAKSSSERSTQTSVPHSHIVFPRKRSSLLQRTVFCCANVLSEPSHGAHEKRKGINASYFIPTGRRCGEQRFHLLTQE